MTALSRRTLLAGAAVAVPSLALAQTATNPHAHHGPLYESLREPGRIEAPDLAKQQAVIDSPAPKAANQGRWIARAPLPLPRSEMAWAVELGGRMHVVGGYGEQRVDRNYHQTYDPAGDRWLDAAALPRGANHVGVATVAGKLYAIGGFIEQNRTPHPDCFVWDPAADKWAAIAPLPEPCGAMACVDLDGKLHAIGGAIGTTFENRKSIDWHLVYDPKTDKWDKRAPLPLGRDHTGTLTANGVIHVIGGRVDSFLTNSSLHHTYDGKEDKWRQRAPLPTPRSGHGACLYRGRIFCMGGEGFQRVFGQNEAFDIARDVWEQYAPMPTPRHGLGAATVGDRVHVAGGGPIMGGMIQSAVHEAFTLD